MNNEASEAVKKLVNNLRKAQADDMRNAVKKDPTALLSFKDESLNKDPEVIEWLVQVSNALADAHEAGELEKIYPGYQKEVSKIFNMCGFKSDYIFGRGP